MNKTVKLIVEIALVLVCIGLVYAIYNSIMQPVRFNRQKDYRESVAIQRLKDIRTLQVAYKSEFGKFAGTIDSLLNFYENGKMTIQMQVGSKDDSIAVAKTAALRKKGLKDTDLFALYNSGEQDLVFSIKSQQPVKESVFADRENFIADSLRTIPFSGGQPIVLKAVIKPVSGVRVPLFEADMPYKALLKGLDNQLIVNLGAERENQNKYNGLQVGSVDAPNNNAGNWE